MIGNIINWLYNKRKFLLIILIFAILFFVAKKIFNDNPNVDKSNEFYTNSIYMSDGRIYNSYLNETEKNIYNAIMERIKKGKTVIYMKPSDYGCKNYNECFSAFNVVTHAIMVDHPELLSFGGWFAQYKPQNDEITLQIKNSFKLPLMNDIGEMIINRKIDKIKKETENMSDKDKIKYVYNWIGENTTYDTIFTTGSKNQTIYNVFVNHNAVCAGFAKASQVIFQRIGIKSYIVEGNTTGPHMWNIVYVDGNYYYYDSTVAACIPKNNRAYYDGLKQSKFSSYKESYDWFPTVSGNELYNEGELN